MSDKSIHKISRNKKQISIFVKRKQQFTLIFLCVFTLFVVSSTVTNYDIISGITSIPNVIKWMATNLIPNEKAWSRFPNIRIKLIETLLLSIAVTVCGAISAFLFSLFGTKITKINSYVRGIVRIIASFFRNIPDVVWAMILLFTFGQTIMTGFIALFFYSFGMLTRTFIETIDEVSASCVEALHSTGSTYLQVVCQGIIPSSLPEIVSWILYMIETNIRSATLIGLLTATGIGHLFDLYYKQMDYGSVSLVVYSIILVVIAIEIISSQIKKAIM